MAESGVKSKIALPMGENFKECFAFMGRTGSASATVALPFSDLLVRAIIKKEIGKISAKAVLGGTARFVGLAVLGAVVMGPVFAFGMCGFIVPAMRSVVGSQYFDFFENAYDAFISFHYQDPVNGERIKMRCLVEPLQDLHSAKSPLGKLGLENTMPRHAAWLNILPETCVTL